MAETYISKVNVDLWQQAVTLEWAGPDAANQLTGPFHCAPGKGAPGLSCDIIMTSRLPGSECTPKGEWKVLGHQCCFAAYPEAQWVTMFQSLPRGIALHYYPTVPEYPASHGCVRIEDYAIAQTIWHNTITDVTIVSVKGELRPKPVVLQYGDNGENVRKVQKKLAERGYAVVADGDFGPATEAAVKRFQKDARLPDVDGIFGQATYTALFSNSRVSAHA